MTRKIIALMLIAGFVLGGVSLSYALGDGNYRKGKYLYRKNCRTCHAEGQSALDMSPMTFTQAEWEAKFQPDAIKGYACTEEFAKRSEKDINDIYTYLWKHAKDSPTPAKCK